MIINKIGQRLLLIVPKKLTAFALSASLLSLGLPFPGHATAGSSPNFKSEAQVKSEAARYDTAIREIGRISELKLATPEGSKTAQGILDKQIPNLRFNRSKLVAFGLDDSSFVSAAKAKAGEKNSAEQFAKELGKDRDAILRLNGAASVANRIRGSVEADTALLRKIGQLLKQASAEIKAKARSHHALARVAASFPTSTIVPTDSEAVSLLTPAETLSPEEITLLVVAAAVVICPPLGLAIFVLAADAAGAAFYVALMAGLLVVETGTEDKVAACQDKARAKCDLCKADATNLVFPLNIAAADACDGELLLDEAACLLTLGLL